jgi:hypothetical protein
MSSKVLCPQLFLIYTCSTFLCRHAAVVSCFTLHRPLLFISFFQEKIKELQDKLKDELNIWEKYLGEVCCIYTIKSVNEVTSIKHSLY